MVGMSHLDDIRSLTERIKDDDERRANRITSRDVAMALAKADGVPWSALRAATGLSLRGAQLAVERGRANPRFTDHQPDSK